MSARTFAAVTLGCKVNQYETEYLCEGLRRLGYRPASEDEAAELCIVNTCTVTAEGDAKSRKAIRHMHRRHPWAGIIVMGCYATRRPAEVARLPGVVEVLADKQELPAFLARLGLVEPPRGICGFGQRHRAYVKVQDGCPRRCGYCIIPLVRPVLHSRPPEEVRQEVSRLVDQGYREIVLTGIHLGYYGRAKHSDPHNVRSLGHIEPHDARSLEEADAHDARPLVELVRLLAGLPGEFRLRLSSLEAAEVSDELLAVMASHPQRICPHLHIPLQSGSPAVLERMGRRWPIARFLERCAAVRAALPRPALTTDVMVGYPGESEADFAATCRMVVALGFAKLHVFRFSPRPGTPAAVLPDRVPGHIQRRRAAELLAIGERLRQQYMQQLIGRPLEVLVEEMRAKGAGRVRGTAERYVPVELPGATELLGRLVRVVPRACVNGVLQAEAVGSSHTPSIALDIRPGDGSDGHAEAEQSPIPSGASADAVLVPRAHHLP
jgi:threonylcarbamoyladenosine tRNA methylthiotransferase MtaB